jgi:hypothetical protein
VDGKKANWLKMIKLYQHQHLIRRELEVITGVRNPAMQWNKRKQCHDEKKQKTWHQKLNPEYKNTIIKIKGSGLRSLTTNSISK